MAEYTRAEKHYMAAVASAIPEGCHVSLGWADENIGAHHDGYLAYCEEQYVSFLQCVEAEEDVQPFTPDMSFQQWKAHIREQFDDTDAEVSYESCDLCGRTTGYSHPATLLNVDDDTVCIPLDICGDCVLYIANGDVPDFD